MTRLTGNAHDALPRRRARCVPDGLVSDRPISAAARLLSASAMACCRSSLGHGGAGCRVAHAVHQLAQVGTLVRSELITGVT